MDRQQQIEVIAKFVGKRKVPLSELADATDNCYSIQGEFVVIWQEEDCGPGYDRDWNPFEYDSDAALVRRKVEERGWLHLRRWNGSHSTQITARHTYTGDWSDNENESFMSTLLLTIEAEGSVK